MSENKYQLTVTETQLRLIAECVEDCHRFMTGQYELHHMTSRLDNYHELQDELRKLKPLVTPALADCGSCYDWCGTHCPNPAQRKFIAQTYPIYREIIHFLTVQRGVENAYSSETLTCEEGGEPVQIVKI